ncbi:aldolase [Halomonas sp. PA5]|nr:aldolase [Halomonas sp. PA5]
MMITSSPDVACYIEQHGIARIFMDQEVMGKAERQGHLDTHKAQHTLEEIAAVARVLKQAELMVRVNPLHEESAQEIEAALDHGAQRLMLPMFTSREEVDCFLDHVQQRVPVTFLAETPQALVRLSDWLPLLNAKQDEVHFGLNDMALGMGLDFLFEAMAGRLFDIGALLLNEMGIRWGVGGVARIGQGELPAEIVLGEHVRLGSQWVILSRAFHQGAITTEALLENLDFPNEIAALQTSEAEWRTRSDEALLQNQKRLAASAFRLGRTRRVE